MYIKGVKTRFVSIVEKNIILHKRRVFIVVRNVVVMDVLDT